MPPALDRLGAVEDVSSGSVSGRVFTVPNVLSMLRLLMVPVFLVFVARGDDVAALIVLAISSITDYLDGVIARRFNQMTKLGQILDPAADRLFIFAALLGLALRDVLPWWLVAVVVARDVFLLAVGVVLANHGYGPLPVHHMGKLATFCLLYAFPLLMLGQAIPVAAPIADPLGWAFGLWGAFIYWWAAVIYARQAARLAANSTPDELPESDTLGR
ncbi:CDP-alcohol phosphatidyltransferase family protein [Salinibacterium sp. dk2585]|nr:CDP-alcohol phosphatidyltransferase family protein [Salinibacterium sp. dk2585]TXK53121.1 CDP-alcohol phosphatidyltransferase family protein [Salinibacterium sp. dk5596]